MIRKQWWVIRWLSFCIEQEQKRKKKSLFQYKKMWDGVLDLFSTKTYCLIGWIKNQSRRTACMWTLTPVAVNLEEPGGDRQDSHCLPYHARFCSIIATCSQWWDRSLLSQSRSSPMADILRLSEDLSSSLCLSLYLKKKDRLWLILRTSSERGLLWDTLVWVYQGPEFIPAALAWAPSKCFFF